MKNIYEDIISQGTTGVAGECGENEKGENLAYVAQLEMLNQLQLFPEMLEMLKKLNQYAPNTCRDLNVEDLIAKAEKKGQRSTKEGLVFSYIHQGGKLGVLLEINCETDFVAKTEGFNELAQNISMQIAATNPASI